jgi:hypothetical protein
VPRANNLASAKHISRQNAGQLYAKVSRSSARPFAKIRPRLSGSYLGHEELVDRHVCKSIITMIWYLLYPLRR